MEHLKRITFYIDQNLNTEFEDRSDVLGITKSQLLKKWISTCSEIYPEDRKYLKRNHMFTFRVENEMYKLICVKAARFGLTISEYLRSLISSNVHTHGISITITNNPDTKTKVFDLWRKGLHGELNNLVGETIDKLNNQDLLHYLNASLEQGCYKNTRYALEILKQRSRLLPPGNVLEQFYYVTSADMYSKERSLERADYAIRQFEQIENKEVNRTALGYYYCVKGEICGYRDMLDEAHLNYTKARDYLDIVNHPWLLMRIYINIGRIWKYKMNHKMALYNIKRVKEINDNVQSVYYRARSWMDVGFFEYTRENFDISEENTVNGMKLYNESGNGKGDFYGHDNLARIELLRRNHDKSYSLFTKAREEEIQFRDADAYSYSLLYKYFIEAKDNYKKGIDQIEKFNQKHRFSFLPCFSKYMYNTTKFLYSKSENERAKAREKLKEQMDGENQLIANAAKLTLQTHRLQAAT